MRFSIIFSTAAILLLGSTNVSAACQTDDDCPHPQWCKKPATGTNAGTCTDPGGISVGKASGKHKKRSYSPRFARDIVIERDLQFEEGL
ncbi:hypothetical protein C8J56DRAFT_1059088 [Mycena floridula]|nr:hypothetical protein C8J56DRAFT_1059088 [Mycena floridula]